MNKIEKFEQIRCTCCGEIVRMFHGVIDREEYVDVWVSCTCGFMFPISFMKLDLKQEKKDLSYLG